jgi:hypothetical protein
LCLAGLISNLENKRDSYKINLLHIFYVSEVYTTPSEDAPTSGGSDGPAAPALAASDSDPKQVNLDKAETQR